MEAIIVKELNKHYQVPMRKPGLTGALKSLLHRQYQTVNALENISFSIKKGESVGYIGPNGAGKTTTLKILSGLLHPDAGNIQVLGYKPLEQQNAFKKRISFVMGQKGQLWWDLPAAESFALLKEIYEIPDSDYTHALEELVSHFDVAKLIAVPVRNLSLGERMKMELIAALLHAPEILFLDEPTIGLDILAQRQIRSLLNEYRSQRNVTIILASHYMKDVEEICERAILIDHGRILYDGALTELMHTFSPQKLITLTFAETLPEAQLEKYGEVIDHSTNKATLKVKSASVANVVQVLLSQYEITDLGLREESLENVIGDIFVSQNEKEER